MLDFEIVANKSTPKIREFIFQLRKFILALSDEVEEKTTNKMICYRSTVLEKSSLKTSNRVRGVFWFNLTNGKHLRIHMRKLGNYPDDYNRIVTEGWGGYPELTFKESELNEDILKYLKEVIHHAFSGEDMDIHETYDSEERIIFDKNIEDVQKRINFQPSNPTVQTLYDNFKDGDLVLSPDFQRNYVWNKIKASNLIESIILNIPLPFIFTAEIENNIEEVVDGQQRLTSIFSFIDGKFPDGSIFELSKNLKILYNEIGGKSYKDLDKNYQKQIKKHSLPLITIAKESQEDVKFEMFERLNTNITPLKEQELRNCLYRGPFNDFIKSMANHQDFHYIINNENLSKRMVDVELVLMFCAFYHKSPDHYNTNIKQMLNIEMRSRQFVEPDELQELEKSFKKSSALVKHIFGKNAFNVYSIDETTGASSYGKSLNYGLYQILMYWFIGYEKIKLFHIRT